MYGDYIYRQPKVILGGSAVTLTFGLGQTVLTRPVSTGFRGFKDGRRMVIL